MKSKTQRQVPKKHPYNLSNPNCSLPNGMKRYCGTWTLDGTRKEEQPLSLGHRHPNPKASAGSRKFVRLRCKCWSCSLCGPRKAKQTRGQIMRAIARKKLTRMLTLTLDPRKIADASEIDTFFEHFRNHKSQEKACNCVTCERVQVRSIKHIRECWAKLRIYMKRRYGTAPTYICVLEFQKITGLAHLHIVIDRYVDHGWAKKSWSAVGGGEHVHIQHVDAHCVASYLAKYLSKEMILSAPLGMRRVTTSRSIQLKEKKGTEYDWNVRKFPIDSMYVIYRIFAEEVICSEGELESFSVRE